MAFSLGSRAISAGYRLAAFDSIGSTNAEAISRARDGEYGPIWFVTSEQTDGRGRRNRRWIAPRGNIACSILEVIDVSPSVAATLGFAAGLAIEAATFIGSSPIRQYAEDWTLEKMVKVSEDAVKFAMSEGLSLMFVTEDTTRANPETLRALYGAAIACGARRVCLADTVGHATPDGVRALVRFVREEIIAPTGIAVKIDWHGHRDRGNGLANCFAAIEAGVDRVHGTALGIGERVGNAEMDLLLVNLRLLGAHHHDLSKLPEYTALASRALGIAIPPTYPVVGEDAFRTATGVHAAAIAKAHKKGDAWLADRIYSGVPAGDFGLSQRIDVGHVSGISNVRSWLDAHGHDGSDEPLCRYILDAAKRARRARCATTS